MIMKKMIAAVLVAGAFFIPSAHAGVDMTIYYSNTCPHCHHARDFVRNTLIYEYPTLAVKQINVMDEGNRALFQKAVSDCGYENGGIPVITINGKCFQGYGTDDTTGNEFRETIDGSLSADERSAVAENRAAMAADADRFKAARADRLNAMSEQIDASQKKNDRTPVIFWAILVVLVAGLGFVL
jgi:glutaredoxin